MHLEDMKYLVCIANNKSINKAAKELSLTQPALSASINRLEQELGVKLLKRSYKGVILTEAGEKIYQESVQILDTISNWYHIANQKQTLLEGNVHILAVPTACDFLTKRLLEHENTAQHKIQIFFHKCHRDVFMEQLATDKINIGVFSIYSFDLEKTMQNMERQGWNVYILHEEEREVFMSQKNIFADKPFLQVEDLQELTLACYSFSDDSIKSLYKRYFNSNHCYYLDGQNSILQLVAENKAVAVYPPKILSDHILVKSGALISKPIQGIALPAAYLLIYPIDDLLSPAEKMILEIIKQEFLNLNIAQ